MFSDLSVVEKSPFFGFAFKVQIVFTYHTVESWQKKAIEEKWKMSDAQAQHKNKEESRNTVSKIWGYYSISKQSIQSAWCYFTY